MKIHIGTAYSRKKFPFNIGALAIVLFQGMVFKKSKFSHFYMSYNAITGNRKYLDSTMFKVSDRLWRFFNKEYKVVRVWEVRLHCNALQLYRYFESFEGTPYAFDQIGGLAGRILGIFKTNPLKNGIARMLCNELALRAIEKWTPYELGDCPDNYDLVQTQAVLEELEVLGMAKEVTRDWHEGNIEKE